MTKENSISTSQLFCVLLLCRLSAEISIYLENLTNMTTSLTPIDDY